MRGKKAKEIRRDVYGNQSIRAKKYRKNTRTGQIIADDMRQRFQREKRTA